MEFFTKEKIYKQLTTDEMIKKSFTAQIIPIFYGQLIPRLLEKYEYEEDVVKDILKEFGKRIITNFMQYWLPKKKSIKGFVKETYRFIVKRKLKKVIEVEKKRKWHMVDADCVMCWMGIEEFAKVHYCTTMSGIIEGGINNLRLIEGYTHLPKVQVETIASKTHGDKMCIHEITVV